jgi:hypothetical protein
MKTALQQAFSDLEELHPNLFNVYTTEGKEFINHFHKYIAMEKEQIIEAYNTSFLLRDKPYSTAEKYYKQTYESNT